MKSEEIKHLLDRFEAATQIIDGVECWSARDLQELLGYSEWRNFSQVIEKAKAAAVNSEIDVDNHFVDVNKMVELGSGSKREIQDIALTRYACYLVAQNGNPTKSEVAFAQNYFAIQTRRAELIEQRLLEHERVKAREKLSQTEKQLSGVLYERGIDSRGFGMIRSKGDQALFNLSTPQFKRKLKVPDNRPVADFLPTISIKAKDLSAEMTSLNVQSNDLRGQTKIEREHVDNNKAVRKMLLERGIVPENLPPSEDVKKVERKLRSEEKKVLKGVKK